MKRSIWIKTTAFICLIISTLLLFVPMTASSSTSPDKEYTSYEEIPAITQEEIHAIEALKEKYDSFVYGMPESTECFIEENGDLGGFSTLFAEELTNLFGIPFKVELFEREALKSGLLDGSIHFTGEGVGAVSGDQNRCIEAGVIARRLVNQMSLYSRESLEAIASERPLRYSFLKDSTAYDLIEPYIHVRHDAIIVDEVTDAFYSLTHNEIDVFVSDISIDAVLTPELDLLIDDFSPTLYNEVSFLSCIEEFKPIITAIEKYLNADGSAEVRDLYNVGHQQYLKRKLWSQFTEEELNYLEIHQNPVAVIPMVLGYDNYPASFYNDRENEWQGIGLDILHQIEGLTGMTFVCVNNREDSWADILAELESGRVVMTSELIRTSERENHYIWSEPPYLTDNYALISKAEYPDLIQKDVKDAHVGAVAGSAHLDYFKKLFPNHTKLTLYNNNSEVFEALEKDKIDMVMGTRNLLLYATNYMEQPGYKENIVLDQSYESQFGFNKDETILCSIVGKTLRLLDTEQISDTWIRKVFDYRGKLARAQVPYLVIFSIIMTFTLAVLVWLLVKNRRAGRRLEQTVQERTATLQMQTKDLAEQTKKAQAATIAKSDFLARMSHEIRTPLNAIMGMTEIAKKQTEPDKIRQSLDSVTTASTHLLGILNDILDMSKIEAGKFILNVEPFDLHKALDEVAEIISQRCSEKNITFIKDVDLPDCTGVIGDKLRLKQVLINLLGNSVKFTKEGGTIIMSAEHTATIDNSFLIHFRASDSGIGISDEQIVRLFDAFEQANSGIATEYGGAGLGLAISQNLIQLMDGEITATSSLGVGSTFQFTIPLKPTVFTMKEEDPVEYNFKGHRILLAEDVAINRIILTEMLAETNINIIAVENGLAALNTFKASQPDFFELIFMDIQMPEMNGYEATSAIRSLHRPDAQAIPIIAMTANAYKEDVEHCMKVGMNAHLSKPIDIVKILQTLSYYLLNEGAENDNQ